VPAAPRSTAKAWLTCQCCRLGWRLTQSLAKLRPRRVGDSYRTWTDGSVRDLETSASQNRRARHEPATSAGGATIEAVADSGLWRLELPGAVGQSYQTRPVYRALLGNMAGVVLRGHSGASLERSGLWILAHQVLSDGNPSEWRSHSGAGVRLRPVSARVRVWDPWVARAGAQVTVA
jgi:hypothetical protein